MKIDRIECLNLRFEYDVNKRFRYSGGLCTARVTSLVLVHADNGQIGIGSCYSYPAIVHTIIKQHLEPLLRGRDASDVEGLWNFMHGQSLWYGRKGAATSALGAIDVALWDLRGKAAGKPVHELLSTSSQLSVPAYASALLWRDTPAQAAEEAVMHKERGFRRMKMRMGKSEEYDTSAVRAVRAAVGPEVDVMVDAGMRYHPELARRVARTLRDCKVFWFEEPFAPEDYASFRALGGAKAIGVSVAAGENEFGVDGFDALIASGGVDIVQADVSRAGGITVVSKVAKMARDAGVRLAPHTWSDAVAVTANAHCLAATPNGVTVEVDQTGNPFIESLLVEPLQIRDGMLKLSRKPGLGVELDMKMVERYKLADAGSMPDGRYSDFTFGTAMQTPAGPYVELV